MLVEAKDEVDYIYFPHYGMLSLLAVLKDGKAVDWLEHVSDQQYSR